MKRAAVITEEKYVLIAKQMPLVRRGESLIHFSSFLIYLFIPGLPVGAQEYKTHTRTHGNINFSSFSTVSFSFGTVFTSTSKERRKFPAPLQFVIRSLR